MKYHDHLCSSQKFEMLTGAAACMHTFVLMFVPHFETAIYRSFQFSSHDVRDCQKMFYLHLLGSFLLFSTVSIATRASSCWGRYRDLPTIIVRGSSLQEDGVGGRDWSTDSVCVVSSPFDS